MKKTFKNLVLYPSIFILSIILAIGFQENSWTPIITIFLVSEHLINWNNTLKDTNMSDFRIFFADQYAKYYYLIFTLILGLITIFLWDLIGFWIFFSYALNFLIFRAFASEGINKLEDLSPSPSKPIQIDNNVWKKNKELLKEFIDYESKSRNSEKYLKIYESIEYSSFLRSTKASEIIDNLINSEGKERDLLLDKLLSKL